MKATGAATASTTSRIQDTDAIKPQISSFRHYMRPARHAGPIKS